MQIGRIERALEHRDVTVDGDEAVDLVAERGHVGRFADRAVAGPFVFLGQAEIVGLVADGHAVLAEEDAEQAVEIAGDLRQERRHVGGAERNAGGADHFAAVLLDLGGIGVARRLAPGIIGIGDVPLLAHLGERRREGDRLRRRVIVDAEAVAVALRGGQRGVEAHADHVDDLGVFPHRHAGETDVGQEAADMGVDIVLLHHLLGLLPRDGRRTLVVDDDQLDRTAVDAAVLVDAVGRHLQADHRGLAAGGAGAGQRLLGTDLIGLGGAEGGAPRRRHQHHGADRAAAPADDAAARDLAAVPDVLRPLLFFPLLSHRKSPSGFHVRRKAHRPRQFAMPARPLTGSWRAIDAVSKRDLERQFQPISRPPIGGPMCRCRA